MLTRLLLPLLLALQVLPVAGFTVADGGLLTAGAPVLGSPPDGRTLTSFGPTLTWQNPVGVTQAHVQVVPAGNDGPGIDMVLGSAATSLAVPAPPQWYGLLPDMTYTWRVRVSDARDPAPLDNSSWGPWAERRFRTPAVTGETISLLSPAGGPAGVAATPVLQWGDTRPDVFYYEVQVSRDPRFDTDPATATAAVYWVLLHGGVTDPPRSFAVPATAPLSAGATYHWRVRPRVQGDGRPVSWSRASSFTTRGPQAVFPPEGAVKPVIAQYYTWYDVDTFALDHTSDIPLVRYNSDDPAAIARHVQEARGAGVDALALSWLGPNDHRTDSNLQKLLASGSEQGLWATITFETDKPQFGTQAQVVAALRYLQERYQGLPNWLRWQGRPVYLFWRPGGVARAGGQSALEAWRSIRDEVDPARQAIWIMEGLDYALLEVFDGQFGYSLAWSPDVYYTTSSWAGRVRARGEQLGQSKIFMATVMPGYDDTRVRPAPEGFVRDRENGGFLAQTWDAAIQAAAEWVNLTSFNEWIEGSQIEPSVTYGDAYLDLNLAWSARFKGG